MEPANPHTELLLKRCKTGDQNAQLIVYNSFYKSMYNTSYRIVKDSYKAEDIMQESFLTAFTKLDSLKDLNLFGAWLKRIVVNNSISSYQLNKKTVHIPLENVTADLEDSEEDNHYEWNSHQAAHIVNEINNLKDNYRLGLNLLLIEGYDYDEICDIMQINYANCRTMISRAKESLRKKLTIPTV